MPLKNLWPGCRQPNGRCERGGAQSGCSLLTSVQECPENADDESAFGFHHLALKPVCFTIGKVFEGQMLKTKKRSGFLKIEDLIVGEFF